MNRSLIRVVLAVIIALVLPMLLVTMLPHSEAQSGEVTEREAGPPSVRDYCYLATGWKQAMTLHQRLQGGGISTPVEIQPETRLRFIARDGDNYVVRYDGGALPVLLPIELAESNLDLAPPLNCTPPLIEPPRAAQGESLDVIKNELANAGWEYTPDEVIDVLVIDTNYGKMLIDLLETWQGTIAHVPVGEISHLTDTPPHSGTTEGHGTYILRILGEIAPQANYHIARVNNASDLELLLSTYPSFLSGDIEIVVNATNDLFEPQQYRDVVDNALRAEDGTLLNEVLWINSAGNIGAGYYTGTYIDEELAGTLNEFKDPNKSIVRGTLSVPVDWESNPSAVLFWPNLISGNTSRMLLGLVGNETTIASPFNVQSTSSENIDGEILPYAYVTNSQLREEIISAGFTGYPPKVDLYDLPFTQRARSETNPLVAQDPDGVYDNMVHVFFKELNTTVLIGQRYELFIQGALPPEYNPYMAYGLDPVVLAPGDLEAVLSVGSYEDFEGEKRMAWYSSRFNSEQWYKSTFVKPDVTTVGYIAVPDPTSPDGIFNFEGTSASTALIGGVAAVMAGHMGAENFDAAQLKTALSQHHVDCLVDGAVGRRIPYLQIKAPDVPVVSEHGCGTYDWQGDWTEKALGLKIDSPSLAVSADPDTLWDQDKVTFTFTVSEKAESVLVDYQQLNVSPPTTEEWITLFGPEPDDDNLCRGGIAAPSGQSIFTYTTSTKGVIPDGLYAFRFRLCADGKILATDAQSLGQIKIANAIPLELRITTEPEKLENSETVYSFRGIAEGTDFRNYFVQAKLKDDSDAVWRTIYGVPGSDGMVPPEICTLSIGDTNAEGTQPIFAPSEDEAFGVIATFDISNRERFPEDGVYEFRTWLCTESGAEYEEPLVEFELAVLRDPDPFVELTTPKPETIFYTGGITTLEGSVGGRGFLNATLTLTGPQGAQVVVGQPDLDAFGDICAQTDGSASEIQPLADPETVVTLVEKFELPSEPGEYELTLTACYDDEEVPERTTSVAFIIEPDTDIKDVHLEPIVGEQEGIVEFSGSAMYPNYQGHTLEYIRAENANDLEADWTPIIPEEPFNGDEVCATFPDATATLQNTVLGELDVAPLPAGDYVVRLVVCADGVWQVEDGDKLTVSVLNIPPEAIIKSFAQDPLPGPQSIAGRVRGTGLTHYIVQIDNMDTPEEVWELVIPAQFSMDVPTQMSDPDVQVHCDVYADPQGLTFGYGPQEILLGYINPARYSNGKYQMRVVMCFDGRAPEVIDTFEFENITIENDVTRKAAIDSPEDGATIDAINELRVIGTAEGTGYTGHVVELRSTRAGGARYVLYPPDASNLTTDELCETGTFPAVGQTGIANDVLYEPQIQDLELISDGPYEVQVTVCINRLARNNTEKEIELDIGNILLEMTAETAGDQVYLLGSAIAPDDWFQGYVVEVAEITEADIPNEDVPEDAWVPVVPRLVATEEVVTDLCALQANKRNETLSNADDELSGGLGLGLRQIEGGTLAVLDQARFSGVLRARINLCLSVERSVAPAYVLNIDMGDNPPGREGLAIAEDETTPVLLYGTPAGALISQLDSGTVIQLLQRTSDNSWVEVSTEEGLQGWIESQHVLNATLDGLDIYNGAISSSSTDTPFAAGVLFASDRTGLWQIYESNGPGAIPTQLTFEGNNEFPSPSPDGEQFAYASDRDGNREIYVMDLDTRMVVNKTNHIAEDYRPAWSPNGKSIVFESDRDGSRELYVLTLVSGEVTQITENIGAPCCVDWASDSQQITFAANRDGEYDIYVANISNAQQVTNLTHSSYRDINPTWLPGGSLIAFESLRDGVPQIFVVDIDGNGLSQITHEAGGASQPEWYGSEILFVAQRNGAYDLFLVDLNGSDPRPYLNEVGSEAGPDTTT